MRFPLRLLASSLAFGLCIGVAQADPAASPCNIALLPAQDASLPANTPAFAVHATSGTSPRVTAVLRSAGRPDITLESPTFNPGISPSIEWIPFRELLPDTDYDLRVSAWCHDGTSDQEECRLHVTAAQPAPTTTGTLN